MLKAASELFLARGYEGVSIDEVIAQTGGTKTNVYTLFGGKAELFAAMVNEQCQKLTHTFADLDLSGLTLEEALRRAGRTYLTTLLSKASVRQHRMMVAESARFPALGRRWFKAGPEGARTALATQLEALPGFGSKSQAGKVAATFLNMLGGEPLMRQLAAGGTPPSTREISSYVDDAITVLLQGTLVSKRR
ncbi:MAG: TetR/AcrR family transcriptional regulator [Nevskia sp.]|nr:TetR/AcrR family transcriptional regulator [Nevskia sp.]